MEHCLGVLRLCVCVRSIWSTSEYEKPYSVGQVEHVERESKKSRDGDTVTESVDTSVTVNDMVTGSADMSVNVGDTVVNDFEDIDE